MVTPNEVELQFREGDVTNEPLNGTPEPSAYREQAPPKKKLSLVDENGDGPTPKMPQESFDAAELDSEEEFERPQNSLGGSPEKPSLHHMSSLMGGGV